MFRSFAQQQEKFQKYVFLENLKVYEKKILLWWQLRYFASICNAFDISIVCLSNEKLNMSLQLTRGLSKYLINTHKYIKYQLELNVANPELIHDISSFFFFKSLTTFIN